MTDQVHSRSISRNLAGKKGVTGCIQCAELDKSATKNYLSSKSVIQNRRRDKEFPRQQKLKEFMTAKPTLQEILRGTL